MHLTFIQRGEEVCGRHGKAGRQLQRKEGEAVGEEAGTPSQLDVPQIQLYLVFYYGNTGLKRGSLYYGRLPKHEKLLKNVSP